MCVRDGYGWKEVVLTFKNGEELLGAVEGDAEYISRERENLQTISPSQLNILLVVHNKHSVYLGFRKIHLDDVYYFPDEILLIYPVMIKMHRSR